MKVKFIKLLVLFPLIVFPILVISAEVDHEALAISGSLSFSEVFESALQNAPEYLEKEVRQNQADAFSANGRSWIAGRPSLLLNYYGDELFDNAGLREVVYGIELPLWRLGERSSNQALANNYQIQVNEWQNYLKLSIAGRVREVLADINEAELQLFLEQKARIDTQQLLDISNSLFQAGDVAQLDVMQAQSQLLDQKKNELQAEAMLVDAERSYATLTGLQVRSDKMYKEELSLQKEVSSQHPLLLFLQSNIDLSAANIRQAEISAKGSPTLSLVSRTERADRFESYTDSINLSLTIPIGGRSFVSAQTSAARREKIDAEVLFLNTRITLEQDLHEIEHQLFLTQERTQLGVEQLNLSEQQKEMSLIAFELGEISMAQVVLALQQARTMQKEYQVQLLNKERLISEFNQTIGVLP